MQMNTRTVVDLPDYHWSRNAGTFLNKLTGAVALQAAPANQGMGPQFFGSIREWYETVQETIVDAADDITSKTYRGPGNVLIVSPETLTILEMLVSYRPIYLDSSSSPIEAITSKLQGKLVGFLANRFAVVCDWDHYPEDKAKIRVLAYDIRGALFARKTIIIHHLTPLDDL